jgi:hypothetical protein
VLRKYRNAIGNFFLPSSEYPREKCGTERLKPIRDSSQPPAALWPDAETSTASHKLDGNS